MNAAEPLEGVVTPPTRKPTLDDMLDGREISPAMRRMYQAFLDGTPIPEVVITCTIEHTGPEANT